MADKIRYFPTDKDKLDTRVANVIVSREVQQPESVRVGDVTVQDQLDSARKTIAAETRILLFPCTAFSPANNALAFTLTSQKLINGATGLQNYLAPIVFPPEIGGSLITKLSMVCMNNDAAGYVRVYFKRSEGSYLIVDDTLVYVEATDDTGTATITKEINVVDQNGNPVYVNFTNHWSLQCALNAPTTVDDHRLYYAKITIQSSRI